MPTQKYREAKISIADDLSREGKISRDEFFRIEIATFLGLDCGLIRYLPEELQDPPEEIGTGLYRMVDGEVCGGEPDNVEY